MRMLKKGHLTISIRRNTLQRNGMKNVTKKSNTQIERMWITSRKRWPKKRIQNTHSPRNQKKRRIINNLLRDNRAVALVIGIRWKITRNSVRITNTSTNESSICNKWVPSTLMTPIGQNTTSRMLIVVHIIKKSSWKWKEAVIRTNLKLFVSSLKIIAISRP